MKVKKHTVNNSGLLATMVAFAGSLVLMLVPAEAQKSKEEKAGEIVKDIIDLVTDDDKDSKTSRKSSFEGVWNTTHGEIRLHQVGSGIVMGDYAQKGVMIGREKGDQLAGVFTNGARNGIFRFEKLSNDEFRGKWAWHGDRLREEWDGRRTDATPPQTLQNFTRNASTTRTLDNKGMGVSGAYSSSYGGVELYSRDLFLAGDYAADKGIIAGMWDGDSFVGRFTNGDRTGWFDFEFFSKTGQFRNGEWGWMDENNRESWKLTKKTGGKPVIDNMLDHVSFK